MQPVVNRNPGDSGRHQPQLLTREPVVAAAQAAITLTQEEKIGGFVGLRHDIEGSADQGYLDNSWSAWITRKIWGA